MSRARFGTCRLHLEKRLLYHGHIKPRFVYKWLGTGFRSVGRPNLRREDGPRRHLLCEECERLLSGWETTTQQQIFEPLHSGRAARFDYGSWFTTFAASVVFRTLIASKEVEALSHFPSDCQTRIDEALAVWRDYILGNRPDLGGFDVHAFILGPIADQATASLTVPGINMYLSLAVGSQVLRTKTGGCFVVVKMAKLAIIGIVQNGQTNWSGTRLDPNGGAIGDDGASIPAWLVAYFNYEATRSLESHARLSDKQKDRIRVDRARRGISKRSLEAFEEDVHFFGLQAVIENTKKAKEQ